MNKKYIKIICILFASTPSYGLFELEIMKEKENNGSVTTPKQTTSLATKKSSKVQNIITPKHQAEENTIEEIKQKHIDKKNSFIRHIKSQELLKAAKNNATPEQIEKLLNQGADINAKDEEGKTPLHWAASEGFFNVVEVLIHNGADVHAQDYMGNSPLHLVVKYLTPRPKQREKIIKLLLKFGASIYSKDFQDRNVLETSDGHLLQRFLVRQSLRY